MAKSETKSSTKPALIPSRAKIRVRTFALDEIDLALLLHEISRRGWKITIETK